METEPKKETKISPLEISEETRAELGALFRGEEWNGEKLPPVFLKLFSGPHATAKDTEGIKPLLDEADIYMPETFDWHFDLLKKFDDLVQGKIFSNDGDDFTKTIKKYLFGTNKSVVLVDVPHEEVNLFPERYGETEDVWKEIKRSSYEQAVDIFYRNSAKNAEIDLINREEHMIQHFSEKIKEAILSSSDLQKKDTIKILMTLGIAHSSIYHLLKNIGNEHVSREFLKNPTYGYENEMVRTVGFGKDAPLEFKEKAFCEVLFTDGLFNFLDGVTDDMFKKEVLLRYFASLFSSEEIRSFFEQWKNYFSDLAILIFSLLKKKNIVFPKNEEEMDAILATTPYGKYQKVLQEKKQRNESSI